MTWATILCTRSQLRRTFKNSSRCWRNIEKTARKTGSTWRQRWPKTELPSWGLKTTTVGTMRWFTTRCNRERSVSKLTSNNTNSLTSNGTKTYSKSKRKTHKLWVSWRTDTRRKSKLTGRNWRTNCPWLSSSAQSCLISSRSKGTWPNRRSTQKLTRCKLSVKSWKFRKEKSIWEKDIRK